LRLFVAVVPPDDVRAALTSIQDALTRAGGDVKWVEPENIHVTLKFLGEVTVERAAEVRAALCTIAAPAFVMGTGDTGAFPPRGKPRVVWIGLEDSGPLVALQAAVERVLQPLGFPGEDRPFAPHLTVGRVRSPKGVEGLQNAIRDTRAARQQWAVQSFTLMESRLSTRGPTYLHVEDFPLGEPARAPR